MAKQWKFVRTTKDKKFYKFFLPLFDFGFDYSWNKNKRSVDLVFKIY